MKVLVTGASGNVGRHVITALRRRGAEVRAAARDADPSPVPAGVERVPFDFADPRTHADAVAGCAALFLMRPPAVSDTRGLLDPFVDVARAAGVAQIVFLSVAGAGTNRLVPHHAVEVHLTNSAGDFTILRPGFFAQNLGDAYRRDLVEDDRLYVPAGRAHVAFVDVRDVAEVAAEACVDAAAHRRRAYTLTGPELVTFDEVAAILAEVLGRPIRYVAASIPGYALHLRRRGLAGMQILVQTILHAELRRDRQRVDPTLRELLGWPGHTIRDYIEDHAALWRPATASSSLARGAP